MTRMHPRPLRVDGGDWQGCQSLNNEHGQLMPMVMGVMAVVAIISVSFVTSVIVRQQLGGHRSRVVAARYLAEAGVERALWALENGSESGLSSLGSPSVLSVGALQGTFTAEVTPPNENGLISIRALGEVGGVRRSVRVVAKLSPHVLTYAMFGDRLIRFEGSESRTYVTPVVASTGRAEGGQLASNGEIWFAGPGISVNDFTGAVLSLRDGELPDHALLGPGLSAGRERADGGIGTLVLAEGGTLTFGESHQLITGAGSLQARGVRTEMDVASIREREILPLIDRIPLRTLAEANTANSGLNEEVGARGWAALRSKRDSVYEREDFLHILEYMGKVSAKPLSGPVYVKGPVVVPEGATLQILDGFLAVEGSLTVQIEGRLEVRHATRSRTFPGIVTIGEVPIVVQKRGILIVDGLVYARGTFDAAEKSVIDIKGALLAADPRLSIRNHDATVVVRYDPVVLITVGIQPRLGLGRTIARVVSWEDEVRQ